MDRGSCFGYSVYNVAQIANINIARSGIEAYSSLGVEERCQQPLRNAF